MGNKSSGLGKDNKSNITNESALHTDLQAQMEIEHHVAVLAEVKERRRRELLAVEEQLTAQIEREAQLTITSKHQQTKLLHDVADSQKELEKKLVDIHQKQEQNRQRLTEELNRAELKIQNDICKFLSVANQESERTRKLLEEDEEQFQKLLSVKTEEYCNLEKATVLAAMEGELAQSLELARSKKISLPVNLVDSQDECIDEFFRNRQKGQAELATKLASEEALQQHAFAALLTRRDQLSQQLQTDITNVVCKLNQLTTLEVKRQLEKSDSCTIALSEMRVQLAVLLSQLLQQQELRKQDLQRLLREMEKQRELQVKDYWLLQYQRLMQSMPVLHFDPAAQPSAPPLSEEPSAPLAYDEASAPPSEQIFVETDCVICMKRKCQVIFIPCGHVCCCLSCDSSIFLCPLCRVQVAQKLLV